MAQKSLLITGASSGIGYDAAHFMAARGWRVFASCRKAADCERLKGEGFESPRIDYQDEASIASGLAEVLEATGGTLDGLFNNGAYAIPGMAEDLPRDALRAIFEANFFGWMDLTRQVIPVMQDQGGGRVVMNSSVLGFIAIPWRGAYTATKFALEGMTDTMRQELHGTGVDVILIEPGPITARFRHNAAAQFRKWIDPSKTRNAAKYSRIEERYLNNLDTPDKFELPARAVSEKLAKALEAKRPRARYRVTKPSHVAYAMQRALPTRTIDWVMRHS